VPWCVALSTSMSPRLPRRLSSSTIAIASVIRPLTQHIATLDIADAGARDWIPLGPTRTVSATASENGPLRDEGAVAFRSEEVLVGAIGWRWNGVGDDGGVRPDPEEGSSTGGDATSGGVRPESVWLSGRRSPGSAGSMELVDVERPFGGGDSSRSILVICIVWSRIKSRMAIPYGE
jgi:hypothetical protein